MNILQHPHTHARSHARKHTHTHTHTYTYTYTYTYTHTHIQNDLSIEKSEMSVGKVMMIEQMLLECCIVALNGSAGLVDHWAQG